MLKNKKILLGICGSIAAYKTAHLVRLLIKSGAEVKVVMTPSAVDFITPVTLATVSKNPVHVDFILNKNGEWVNHVALGMWADLFLIAPLSASTLAKLATGNSDNLLVATYLSAKCPVMVAPAMDLDMYQHPTTTKNLATLQTYGNIVLPAEEGELASGLSGVGRMPEPEHIVEKVIEHFYTKEKWHGKKVLITSGPTHEPLDPVRFIGNHSTGKMGKALALEAAAKGANVIFISGPSNFLPIHPHVEIIPVTTAEQMYEATAAQFALTNIAIFAAAVADYRPKEAAPQKIKKEASDYTIELVKNKDIALEMGKRKSPQQINIGFALETENEVTNAQKKLDAKNFDLLVLNSLNDEGAGFAHDTNKVTVFSKYNKPIDFELKSKEATACEILNLVDGLLIP